MNRRLFGTLVAVAALSLNIGGCKGDPLSDLDGAPAAIVIDFNQLQLAVGDTGRFTASVVDGRFTPLAEAITFTPCSGDVGAAVDTSYHPVPATAARVLVTGLSPNASCVQVMGGGLVDTVDVTVLPQTFGGALSTLTPTGGDTLVIASTAVLKFNPATVAVTFGGGAAGTVVSATADTIKVLVPFSAPGPLTIDGIVVTYVPGMEVALATGATVTQTGDLWSGDDAYTTAPVLTIPALGETASILTNFNAGDNSAQCAETAANFDFGSTGPCVIYQFTVAAPTTIKFTTDWDSNADLDIYVCSAPDPMTCFEDGFAGATGAQPQATEFTFPAGTHYFVVENYDGTATSNIYVTIAHN